MKNFLLATVVMLSGGFVFAGNCDNYSSWPLHGNVYEMTAVLVYINTNTSPDKKVLSIERADIAGETVHIVNLQSVIIHAGETEPRTVNEFLKVEAAPGTCDLSIKKFVPRRAGSK